MTKKCWQAIHAANVARGFEPESRAVGAYTTFTRGFGQKDDLRIAIIINDKGGAMSLCQANLRAFKKHLARQARFDALDRLALDRFDRPFVELDIDQRKELQDEL